MASSAGGTRGVFCALVRCRTFVWALRVRCRMFCWAGHDTSSRHRATVEIDSGAGCNPVVQRALADDAVTFHQLQAQFTAALQENAGGLQMHLVHINTAYASTEEAYNHRDGLLVVAVLFKVEARENRALGNVVKTLRQMNERVERRGRLSQLASLADLLPQKPSFSYFYRGSLTTPPCAEAVIWAVLKNYEKISESQFRFQFSDLRLTRGFPFFAGW
ncbi:hypothetical protein HPB52_002850 [Rhipicephalus sanguineus]|uniref:carbonic anhydrase n=1 Tax=Rhipicephalus sanguineus TaxID=34632 RepID=A0A9D4PTW8_RHISA|nr:hypothetical protein HPB52_002850 [Rhipicephalus sanguineus]